MLKYVLIALLTVSVPAQEVTEIHTPRNIQSPYVAADFWTQWESTNPRMALFLLVTPQSFWTGINPIGFTSNTRNMTLPGHPGITFYATPALTPTAVEQALGDGSNLEMMGIYQSGLFEQADVYAGKWNFAEVEVFSASWDTTAINYGELVHFTGNLGEFKDYQSYFNAEGRGLIARLSSDVGKVTQRHCRVKDFGDAECGKSLAGTRTVDGTAYNIRQTPVDGVQSIVAGAIRFDVSTFAGNLPADAPELEEDYGPAWANGKITALSGANTGISREITIGFPDGVHPGMSLALKREFPYPITGTISFTIVMGCTRTPEDCKSYTNIINFRGEQFVPGIESANRIDEAQ